MASPLVDLEHPKEEGGQQQSASPETDAREQWQGEHVILFGTFLPFPGVGNLDHNHSMGRTYSGS